MILASWLDGHSSQSFRLKVSAQGHSFITLVVSFLLVSRVNTCLSRYNEARSYVGLMYQHVRELVQDSCVFSRASTDDNARQWRHDVAYQAVVLLRTAMVVIDHPGDQVWPWNIPELNGPEKEIVLNNSFLNPNNLKWSYYMPRDDWEEAMRLPVRISYLLRKTIQAQTRILVPPNVIAVVQENRLHSSVDAIMNGYYGLTKFMTTPVPFPLIQVRFFLLLSRGRNDVGSE
jgi:Bestrophin, RFP-TM, chloride channel